MYTIKFVLEDKRVWVRGLFEATIEHKLPEVKVCYETQDADGFVYVVTTNDLHNFVLFGMAVALIYTNLKIDNLKQSDVLITTKN